MYIFCIPQYVPATASPISHCTLYLPSHFLHGNSSLTYSATPCEDGTKSRNHSATDGSSSRKDSHIVSRAICSNEAVCLLRSGDKVGKTFVVVLLRKARSLLPLMIGPRGENRFRTYGDHGGWVDVLQSDERYMCEVRVPRWINVVMLIRLGVDAEVMMRIL